ncbi:MAG: S-layer homology domain-containing protein [Clostridia bacterium]|nr:S-layer homology domain-containing protein [Clostridia bacterium]
MHKRSSKLLAVILALLFAVSMFSAAMAYSTDDSFNLEEYDYSDDFYDTYEDVYVMFMPGYVEMTQGETLSVDGIVSGDDGTVSYTWRSDNSSVVSVSGRGATATLRAIGPGTASVSLTATRKSDGDYDVDVLTVTVTGKSTPVRATGGDSVVMKAGESKAISVRPSGGSGHYVYEWEAGGSAGVNDVNSPSNTLYGRYAGAGSVICTVSDENDPTNYAVVTWDVTVSDNAKPLTVKLDKTRFNLEAGSATTLTATASGGSGNYDYYWGNDNKALVNISGDGDYVTVEAAPTIMAGSTTAQVSVTAVDLDTNKTSETVYCIFTVTGKEASYSTTGSATVGVNYSMSDIALDISRAFSNHFSRTLSASASIRFDTPSDSVGSLRLRDGTIVRSGASYTYSQLQMMNFTAASSGTFLTGYTLTDGSAVMSGTISIKCSGGSSVRDAYLSASSLGLERYSSRFLSITVTPSNANYTVSWSTSNSNVAKITGSGNNVTVVSQGNTGRSTITATVRDANGAVLTRSCEVTVSSSGGGGGGGSSMRTYNPSLTVTMGSDYYGTSISDSIQKQWRSVFGSILPESAQMGFNSNGTTRYGELRLYNGRSMRYTDSYTFGDFIDMYFEPYAVGTYSVPYYINYDGCTMSGTMSIQIKGSSLSVSIDPSSVTMSTYNNRNIYVNVSPSNAYYRVSWSSSNSNLVSVSGSGSSAKITTYGKTGTATVTATVTDNNGNKISRSCSVKVSGSSNSSLYDPTVYTTLGVNYTGTGTSDAMYAQFKNVYGVELNRSSARISFSNTGNNNVGVMRLSNGTAIRANTSYTFSEYIAMYTEPIATGTFSIPYTLTYNNKTLSGTVSVVISEGSVNCTLNLPNSQAYLFSDPLSGSNGAALLANAIHNALGTSWNDIRFSTYSDSTGTLYLNSGLAALSQSAKITSSDMNNLYFVPQRPGTFSANFSVYNKSGTKISSGTLRIVVPSGGSSGFTDVSPNAYYAEAVTWAVENQITTGTSETTFSPASTVTRAQAVTFLWRAHGRPEAGTMNPFNDVAPDEYYTQAVLWAVKQGITTGTSDTTFSPDATLTQDQMLTFLCRANGDFAGGESWSEQAMTWGQHNGLFDGMPSQVSAKSPCPRCDVVYYLWKMR